MNWNPNTPRALGIEWLPTAQGSVSLDRLDACVAMSVAQTTSQTISQIRVLVSEVPTPGGSYILEVYSGEDGAAQNGNVRRVGPAADVEGGYSFLVPGWRTQANASTNLYAAVNESVLDTTNYIYTADARNGVKYVFRPALGVSATDRPLAVTLGVVARLGFAAAAAGVRFGLRIGGVEYLGPTGFARAGRTWQQFSYTWRINPATQKPWRVSEIEALSTTDAAFIEPSATAANRQLQIAQIFVDWSVAGESRLARGTTRIDAPGWVPFVMSTTPTMGSWTKPGSGRLLYTLRKVTPQGRIVVPTLAGEQPPPNARGFSPELNASTFEIVKMGAPTPTVLGLLQETSSAVSVDSQPYAFLNATATHTSTSISVSQSFTGVAQPYGAVRVAVRPGKDLPASNLLTVELRKSSDDSLIGSGTLTVDDARALKDLGDGWRVARIPFSSAATLTAASYYLRAVGGPDSVEMQNPPIDGFWQLRTVASGSDTIPPAGYNEAGFAGALNANGSTKTGSALPFVLHLGAGGTGLPAAPGSFSATVTNQAVPPTGPSRYDALEYVELTWSSTGIGADFLYYELQRDDTGTWQTIRRVRAESTSLARDYESRRGVSASYRIRSVLKDGTTSAWSATVSAATTSETQIVALVSNHDPTKNVIVEPANPDIAYEFLGAGDLQTVAVYGRDNQLAYQPTEDRGVRASFAVTVRVSDEPDFAEGGLEAFGPLRALSLAPLPYVCVLDPRGGRMYATLAVPSGSDSSAAIHVAEVVATSISDAPLVVDDNPLALVY